MRQRKVTYSVEEAARILGVSSTKLYRSVKAGDLPAVQLGRRVVIPAVALERLLGTPLDGETPESPPGFEPIETLNQVTVAGHLTRDPVVRTSRSGTTYATFRLAIRAPRDPGGLQIQVIAFGPRADIAAELSIGQPVRVEGRLSQREWLTPDGTSRRSHRIIADRVVTLASPTRTCAS